MATTVDLGEISMTPVNSLTSKTPFLVQIVDYISYVIRVIVNYALKFPNFRCHSSKGPSDYFNDTVKLHDLKKLLFGARIFNTTSSCNFTDKKVSIIYKLCPQ